MDERRMEHGMLSAFIQHLKKRERSSGTIEKYVRDVSQFAAFLNEAEVTRGGQRPGGTACWSAAMLR